MMVGFSVYKCQEKPASVNEDRNDVRNPLGLWAHSLIDGWGSVNIPTLTAPEHHKKGSRPSFIPSLKSHIVDWIVYQLLNYTLIVLWQKIHIFKDFNSPMAVFEGLYEHNSSIMCMYNVSESSIYTVILLCVH